MHSLLLHFILVVGDGERFVSKTRTYLATLNSSCGVPAMFDSQQTSLDAGSCHGTLVWSSSRSESIIGAGAASESYLPCR